MSHQDLTWWSDALLGTDYPLPGLLGNSSRDQHDGSRACRRVPEMEQADTQDLHGASSVIKTWLVVSHNVAFFCVREK